MEEGRKEARKKRKRKAVVFDHYGHFWQQQFKTTVDIRTRH